MSFVTSKIEDTYVLPDKPLGDIILNSLRNRNPNNVLQVDVHSGEELTCGRLIEDSIKFSKILKTLGLQKNDVLTLISANDIKYTTFLLGAFYNGVIVNALNPDYFKGELKHGLNLAKPKLIICCKSALQNILEITTDLEFIKKVITVGLDCDDSTTVESIENLFHNTTVDVENFSPDDLDFLEQGAAILISSGTTGLPKGVLLTHANLRENIIYFSSENYFNVASTTTIQMVPNFHIFGMTIQLASIASDLKVILMKKFTPGLFLSAIEKYQVVKLFTVPSLLLFLVKSPLVAQYNLSSVTDIFVGAAPVSAEIQNEFQQRFPNTAVNEFYGATEISGAVTVQTRKYNKPGSSGIIISKNIAKVAKVNNSMESLGPCELGELCFKGPQIMKEYVGNSIATKESFDEDGFYHTGDLGYYDNDMFFYVVDRIKELIKYKGFQVSPAELEALILSHSGVKDCGVIGIPDERSGELPLAFVIKQQNVNISEDEIIEFVAERISVQKRLYGGVRFIDEIPRNPSGKILRRKLMEIYMQY